MIRNFIIFEQIIIRALIGINIFIIYKDTWKITSKDQKMKKAKVVYKIHQDPNRLNLLKKSQKLQYPKNILKRKSFQRI